MILADELLASLVGIANTPMPGHYRPGRPAPEWRKPTKHYKTVSKAARKAAAKSRKINRRR
jgi:hypothetical protein